MQKVAILLTDVHGKTALALLLDKLEQVQGRLILLGSGDKYIEQQLNQIISEYDSGLFLNGYDAKLSDSLFELGELFLMPSSFEPCGISQLLAMRAGQPCIVNQIGGLNDTVIDGETGFCFNGNSPETLALELIACFERALHCYHHQPQRWLKLVHNARETRFEWQDVIPLYKRQLYQLSDSN